MLAAVSLLLLLLATVGAHNATAAAGIAAEADFEAEWHAALHTEANKPTVPSSETANVLANASSRSNASSHGTSSSQVRVTCMRNMHAMLARVSSVLRPLTCSLPLERASVAARGTLRGARRQFILASSRARSAITAELRRRSDTLAAAKRNYWKRDRVVSLILRQSNAGQWYRVLKVRRTATKKQLKDACARATPQTRVQTYPIPFTHTACYRPQDGEASASRQDAGRSRQRCF